MNFDCFPEEEKQRLAESLARPMSQLLQQLGLSGDCRLRETCQVRILDLPDDLAGAPTPQRPDNIWHHQIAVRNAEGPTAWLYARSHQLEDRRREVFELSSSSLAADFAARIADLDRDHGQDDSTVRLLIVPSRNFHALGIYQGETLERAIPLPESAQEIPGSELAARLRELTSFLGARAAAEAGPRYDPGAMDEKALERQIERWEDLHTEFKRWPVHAEDLAAGLVAFANTDGGQIVFGVGEDRQILGVPDSDRLARDVDNVAANNTEPPITVLQETVRMASGTVVLVVHIPKGDLRPYRTNRGVYYVRTSSGRRQASREELLRLFQATESLYYDETPLLRLSVQDLDLDAFDKFLEETGQSHLLGDREPLLANWSLVTRSGHPTVAGLLLFGRRPQQHLPYAQINAARFPGTDSSADPSDRKDLAGRLLDVIDQAERFLDLHLPTPHEIRGFEPEPRPELPKEALREAIVNAVAHRDYTIRGPIRLFVFDDRIEVHTPGKPPNSVDAQAMRAGAHVVRNPWIYARISDAGLVTRAGTGIRRMIRLVREATGREVGLEVRDFEVLVTLPRKT